VHLSQANLVDGSFGTAPNAVIVPTGGVLTGNVTIPSQSLPPSKITPNQYFIVYSAAGINYFHLVPIAAIFSLAGYTYKNVGLTPIQAYNIDVKLDDGMPNSGTVIALSITSVTGGAPTGAPSVAATSTPNTCTVGSGVSTDTYNRVLSTGGNDGSCSLRFRFN